MKQLFAVLFFLICSVIAGQDLARFKVLPVPGAGVAPVSVSLDGVNYNTDEGRIGLFESGITGYAEIPSQIETGTSARLWFLFDSREGEKKYVIRRIHKDAEGPALLSFEQAEEITTLKRGNSPVLAYNHATIAPPVGADERYSRSAYIHPLWSPGGEVLTRIQPPDHFHHYGIWNPWTSTVVDGLEVDFWNLAKGEGTVEFAGYLNKVNGHLYAGIKIQHEHIYFEPPGIGNIAINEVWDVRVWETGIDGITVADLTTTLNTPVNEGVMLNAYRYGGGIGYRATEKWHKDNCTVLTSEGKDRSEADGTNAKWCIVEGESSVREGRSGILFLSHPANRKHPEPMRVWPLDSNRGRGDMFFEFCPIRHAEWKLEHGQNHTLKYRMVIFDGRISPEEAEKYWKSFAILPKISFY